MLPHRHNRFADDVSQVSADGKIPIPPNGAKGRTGNETPAHAEKAAEHADDKSDKDQIKRADVSAGNWKKHNLVRPTANESQQIGRDILKKDSLPHHQQKRDGGISDTVTVLQLVQSFAEEMQDA